MSRIFSLRGRAERRPEPPPRPRRLMNTIGALSHRLSHSFLGAERPFFLSVSHLTTNWGDGFVRRNWEGVRRDLGRHCKGGEKAPGRNLRRTSGSIMKESRRKKECGRSLQRAREEFWKELGRAWGTQGGSAKGWEGIGKEGIREALGRSSEGAGKALGRNSGGTWEASCPCCPRAHRLMSTIGALPHRLNHGAWAQLVHCQTFR